MVPCKGNGLQGMRCPACGQWGVVTTYIEPLYTDETEYSLYIKKPAEIDRAKLKFVSKTAGVHFVTAKQMLLEQESCILKERAPKVKEAIAKLEELGMEFYVSPSFLY